MEAPEKEPPPKNVAFTPKEAAKRICEPKAVPARKIDPHSFKQQPPRWRAEVEGAEPRFAGAGDRLFVVTHRIAPLRTGSRPKRWWQPDVAWANGPRGNYEKAFITAFDLKTGRRLWKREFPNPQRPKEFSLLVSPVVVGKYLVLQERDLYPGQAGRLHIENFRLLVVRSETGGTVWRSPFTFQASDDFLLPLADGKVALSIFKEKVGRVRQGTIDIDGILAVDIGRRAIAWSHAAQVRGALPDEQGNIHILTSSAVTALRAENGTVKWRRQFRLEWPTPWGPNLLVGESSVFVMAPDTQRVRARQLFEDRVKGYYVFPVNLKTGEAMPPFLFKIGGRGELMGIPHNVISGRDGDDLVFLTDARDLTVCSSSGRALRRLRFAWSNEEQFGNIVYLSPNPPHNGAVIFGALPVKNLVRQKKLGDYRFEPFVALVEKERFSGLRVSEAGGSFAHLVGDEVLLTFPEYEDPSLSLTPPSRTSVALYSLP